MLKGKVDTNDYRFPYNVFILFTGFIGTLFNEEKKFKLYQRISQIGNRKQTEFVGIYNNLYKSLARLYKPQMMDEVIEHRFEDTMLDITTQYDQYLNSVYGDYMTPPSMDDRLAGNFGIMCNDNAIKIENSKHSDI